MSFKIFDKFFLLCKSRIYSELISSNLIKIGWEMREEKHLQEIDFAKVSLRIRSTIKKLRITVATFVARNQFTPRKPASKLEWMHASSDRFFPLRRLDQPLVVQICDAVRPDLCELRAALWCHWWCHWAILHSFSFAQTSFNLLPMADRIQQPLSTPVRQPPRPATPPWPMVYWKMGNVQLNQFMPHDDDDHHMTVILCWWGFYGFSNWKRLKGI